LGHQSQLFEQQALTRTGQSRKKGHFTPRDNLLEGMV
jgi:hypothetical protein